MRTMKLSQTLNRPSALYIREAWPTATPEQRDAALKRRFEDGLSSTEMIQFLRLHARDLDFQATVVKARQFADATGQRKPRKRVNFIDQRPRSPAQPEWEPLLQGFRDMMAGAFQPLQLALRSQDQGSAPRSTASTPPQSRPATPQLNPPPRGAWQNRSQRNDQGSRAGNAKQSAGIPRTFSQTQGRGIRDGRPATVSATTCHPAWACSSTSSWMLCLWCLRLSYSHS